MTKGRTRIAEKETEKTIKSPVAPVKTGAQCLMLAKSNTLTFKEGGVLGVFWIPAFAGMTRERSGNGGGKDKNDG